MCVFKLPSVTIETTHSRPIDKYISRFKIYTRAVRVLSENNNVLNYTHITDDQT